MATIHLIFNTEEIDVDKNILLQFDYFRSILEIESDNIKVNHISIKLFKILICMLETENDLVKDIANLSDFLGHDGGCKSLADFKCTIENCNRIALNKIFCELHKCAAEGCYYGDKLHKYCVDHRCNTLKCENIKCNKFYCVDHRCITNECSKERNKDSDVCYSHKCPIPNCKNHALVYNGHCATHKCKVKVCNSGHDTNIYCNYHGCRIPYCQNLTYGWSAYCQNHKCLVLYCTDKCNQDNPYCILHKYSKN